jgi:signal transduction histidine kinase
MTGVIVRTVGRPADAEQRASVAIFVAARWVLVVTALVAADYRPDFSVTGLAGINLLVLVAALLNVLLQARLRRGQPLPVAFPVAASIYDAAAITVAVGLVDGFTSSTYIFYYPALLAFGLVFPGRWSIVFAAATGIAYTAVVLATHGNFHPGDAHDQKVLLVRVATIAATVVIANLVVRIERQRRLRAVAAESERAAQVLALEQRAHDAERELQSERRRLSREVHDGISQSVYMLALGLETAAVAQDRTALAPDTPDGDRLKALVRLARQTLLDTRSLLFDLEGVMAGETSLAALLQHQTAEFQAVTGISVQLTVHGDERPLSPAAVGEFYRITQEALANVYKHAGARSVQVQLSYGPKQLALVMADDGAGMPEQEPARRGNGLRNMRERAARLSGRLALASSTGCGTRIELEIPYPEALDGADPHPAG